MSSLAGELRNTGHQVQETWRFLSRSQRLILGGAGGLMAAVGFLSARIPLTLGALMDAILKGHVRSMPEAGPFLATVLFAYLAREGLQVVRKILVEGVCTGVERDEMGAAVSRLLQTELGALKLEQAGAINGRLNRSVTGLVKLLKLSFLDLFPALFGAAFALFAAIMKNPALGVLMAGVAPVGLLVIWTQMATQRGVRLALMSARERMDGSIVELIGGIETVRAADTLAMEMSRVQRVCGDLRKKEFRHHQAMALFDSVKGLNEGIFHIAVVSVAFWMSLSGVISPGDVLAFSILFLAIVAPLREIHRVIDEAHESGLRTEAYFEILARPIDPSFLTSAARVPDLVRTALIEARDLQVRYFGHEPANALALQGISLSIRSGEMIGFAGPSGSGKTTLIRALLRLVHPSGGSLTIGGVDIQNVTRSDLGSICGLVSQNPFLFSGSIAENIAYGCGSVGREQIEDAARRARIHDEICAFTSGYDHLVAERGENLSGGQRQRIALARIFLLNPPVLILDEATAALDNDNERAVMEAIQNAADGRTTLMVAHRLSSLERCDRIIVLKEGRIVEEGTFVDLAARSGGLFAGLVHGGSPDEIHVPEKAAVETHPDRRECWPRSSSHRAV